MQLRVDAATSCGLQEIAREGLPRLESFALELKVQMTVQTIIGMLIYVA